MSSLYFYYATMNAGKSSNLLQDSYNYFERGMKTLLLKPDIDTREGRSVIRSRIGLEAECLTFPADKNIYHWIRDLLGQTINEKGKHGIACIFVDEAQFMTPEQVEQLAQVVDDFDVPALCYGLRSDFQGNLFPGSSALFARAAKLKEIKTICWCGKSAHMVLRLDSEGNVVREGNQVQIGGNSTYVSVCHRHFSEGKISS